MMDKTETCFRASCYWRLVDQDYKNKEKQVTLLKKPSYVSYRNFQSLENGIISQMACPCITEVERTFIAGDYHIVQFIFRMQTLY